MPEWLATVHTYLFWAGCYLGLGVFFGFLDIAVIGPRLRRRWKFAPAVRSDTAMGLWMFLWPIFPVVILASWVKVMRAR